ncbi:hypothetical protein [Kribbella shirazensis]|uniref:Uncharacterized protein n=1 Tax=Kribbella shirazensis TaxID=1105143 RepID=A0A7X6A342_9ACTN|nr:hypothetical protein [Kribbella shirazensis]NIK59946.1 hypothetical protein [Kribbella shirazensis]
MRIALNRLTASLALLAVTLGLLAAGGFISFTDGGGPDWTFSVAKLMVIPAAAAVVVAWPEPKARLWLGIVLGVLTLLIVWEQVVNVSFRFIWVGSEAELMYFEGFVFLLSCLLVTTAGVALGAKPWLLRIPAYLIGIAAVTMTFGLLSAWFFGRSCTGEEEQGCMAAAGGLVVGMAAGIIVCPLLILVVELILWVRRRRKAAEVGSR